MVLSYDAFSTEQKWTKAVSTLIYPLPFTTDAAGMCMISSAIVSKKFIEISAAEW